MGAWIDSGSHDFGKSTLRDRHICNHGNTRNALLISYICASFLRKSCPKLVRQTKQDHSSSHRLATHPAQTDVHYYAAHRT